MTVQQVSAPRRPAHLLALAHPRVDHLVDGRLRHRRRDRLARPVPPAISDDGAVVVVEVLEELAHAPVKMIETVLEPLGLGNDRPAHREDAPHLRLGLLAVGVGGNR